MASLIIVPNNVAAGVDANAGKAVITGAALDSATGYQIGWDVAVEFTDSTSTINQAIIDAVKYQCVLLEIPVDEPGDIIRLFGALA